MSIDEAEQENQRQQHQERLDNQQFAADLEKENRGVRGFDPSQSEAADAAEFKRREQAALHTSEGSYSEARYGSEESQGLITEETHP